MRWSHQTCWPSPTRTSDSQSPTATSDYPRSSQQPAVDLLFYTPPSSFAEKPNQFKIRNRMSKKKEVLYLPFGSKFDFWQRFSHFNHIITAAICLFQVILERGGAVDMKRIEKPDTFYKWSSCVSLFSLLPDDLPAVSKISCQPLVFQFLSILLLSTVRCQKKLDPS